MLITNICLDTIHITCGTLTKARRNRELFMNIERYTFCVLRTDYILPFPLVLLFPLVTSTMAGTIVVDHQGYVLQLQTNMVSASVLSADN